MWRAPALRLQPASRGSHWQQTQLRGLMLQKGMFFFFLINRATLVQFSQNRSTSKQLFLFYTVVPRHSAVHLLRSRFFKDFLIFLHWAIIKGGFSSGAMGLRPSVWTDVCHPAIYTSCVTAVRLLKGHWKRNHVRLRDHCQHSFKSFEWLTTHPSCFCNCRFYRFRSLWGVFRT